MTLNTGLKRVVDLNLWTCDLKINRDHLLIVRNPCTKFGIDQVKGSKDIERTTHWAQEWFDLDLWTCDLKPIWSSAHWAQPLHQVWYWSSEGVKRYWADNTWSTNRQTDRPTYRPTDRQTAAKQYAPFFKGGIKKHITSWQMKHSHHYIHRNMMPW